jgi:hypothetical protein
MRKYLVATAIGAMLLAGQAAASEGAIVNVGDRIGAASATANGLDNDDNNPNKALFGLGAALLLGLLIWGFTEGGHGHPASP